jgi:hypothetical protein
VNNDSDSVSDMEINNSMLEDQPSSGYTNIIQQQYKVQQIGNAISHITDIEKYSFKRIVAVPIADRDKIMDHICFVLKKAECMMIEKSR